MTQRPAPWSAAPGVLMFVAALAAMSQSMVIPVLGGIERDLAQPPSAVNWALIGGTLAGAVSTPLWGRLGDLVGHRRVLLLMLAALLTGSLLTALAGSLLTALAGSLLVLIAGRVIAGVSASAYAVAIATIRSAALPAEHARSIGAVAAGSGIGTGSGLSSAACRT